MQIIDRRPALIHDLFFWQYQEKMMENGTNASNHEQTKVTKGGVPKSDFQYQLQ